jgi:hypothetical protein
VVPWHLGLLVGIGLLTKLSTLFLIGVVPLAILLKWWMGNGEDDGGAQRAGSLRTLFLRLAGFALPALALGAIWWTRNLNVYGWPDFLGLGRHHQVVADQLRTADKIAAIGWSAYLREAVGTTFNSFWGQFGWMAVPMPEWAYGAIQVMLLVVVSGLVVEVVGQERKRSPTPPPNPLPVHGDGEKSRSLTSSQEGRSGWLVLGATLVLALAAFVYYNTEFVQFQGRYLFPGLIPFALLMALGVDRWRQVMVRMGGNLPGRPYLGWVVAVAFLPLAALDVYLLWRVIVPGLAP